MCLKVSQGFLMGALCFSCGSLVCFIGVPLGFPLVSLRVPPGLGVV